MNGARARGAILLDKDGVLVDFHRTWKPAIKRAAARVARLAVDTEPEAGDGMLAARLLAAVGHDASSDTFLPGSIWAAGTQEELFDAWAAALPGVAREAIAAEVTAELSAAEPLAPVPLGALQRALEEARNAGWKLAVVTNDLSESARTTARRHGYEHLLEAIVGSDMVQRPKPWPDLVHHAAARLALPPACMVVIGDNVHDGKMARAAGCAAFIGVTSGTSGREDLAPLAAAVEADVLAALRRALTLWQQASA